MHKLYPAVDFRVSSPMDMELLFDSSAAYISQGLMFTKALFDELKCSHPSRIIAKAHCWVILVVTKQKALTI